MVGKMSYQPDTIDWQAINTIDRWLDSAVQEEYIRQPLAQDWARIGKVIEELGEAITALIGYTGQNPRKGVTHTRREMLEELADTVITGILAIQHYTKNTTITKGLIRDKVLSIEKRVPREAEAEPINWAGRGFMA